MISQDIFKTILAEMVVFIVVTNCQGKNSALLFPSEDGLMPMGYRLSRLQYFS
jgi:hypothetical protein